MLNNRSLTKSRFKLALECPAKLNFTSRAEYADIKKYDSFLKSLAEGGYQVGEMAKLLYEGGTEVTSSGYEKQLADTAGLLNQENVTVFEGALSVDNLFIRVDILVKAGNQLKLIEVKSKSYAPPEDEFFLGSNGNIRSDVLPYLYDVAFQTYVAKRTYPELQVTPYLLLPDKSAAASVEGLNQMFRIERLKVDDNRIKCVPMPNLTRQDLGDPILKEINVEQYVNKILTQVISAPGCTGSLEKLAKEWSDAYANGQWIYAPIQSQCKSCEFHATPESNLKSGFTECWTKALNLADGKLTQPTVLDLWDGRRTETWIKQDKYWLSQLNLEDIAHQEPNEGINRTERQWMQISGEGLDENGLYFEKDIVRQSMEEWVYPLNLIDFETSRSALPFHKGARPFDLVAFQFSHHILYEDGTVVHANEFLQTTPHQHPNLDFLRSLKNALSANTGSVMIWSPYENSVLNGLLEQMESGNLPQDAEALREFVFSLTWKKENNVLIREGKRKMIDLCELSKKAFFHKSTNGSNSIKKVLPAMLNSSEFLKSKYSLPIYGGGRHNSKNFTEPTVWWQPDVQGQAVDPYQLLPKVFEDLEVTTEQKDETSLNQGGAAIIAYARLQSEDISADVRKAWEKALLKYCELDTLAMVMVVEGWIASIAEIDQSRPTASEGTCK